MKVKELKKILEQMPDENHVIFRDPGDTESHYDVDKVAHEIIPKDFEGVVVLLSDHYCTF